MTKCKIQKFCVSRKTREKKVDGHGHTSHLEVKKERDWKARVKSREVVQAIGRQEAARLILEVLPKLGQEWKREPQILPGWKDSL